VNRREFVQDGIRYAPEVKFRVVKEGLRLNGMTPIVGGMSGWSQTLKVGDVLTCTGFGPGWGGDPGYGVEFTTEESIAARASHCDLWPSTGGPFGYRPKPGYLEPLDSDEAQEA
jgi:hypothetical protein